MNIEHRTLKGKYELVEMNVQHRTFNFQRRTLLQETEELIKIFVTSIKTAVRQAHGPERSRRAEKKK
jgi:hypothetical protein